MTEVSLFVVGERVGAGDVGRRTVDDEADVMPADEARAKIDAARGRIDELIAVLDDLWRGRAWVSLGYDSWQALCDIEFPNRQLPRSSRGAVVRELRATGMSQPAIAAAVNAPRSTIRYDLQGGETRQPADVTGTDGKTYPNPQPSPPTAPIVREPSAEERALLEQLAHGKTVVVSMRGQHASVIARAEDGGLLERIDRRSVWGNPFEIPNDGDRAEVIAKFEKHYLPHKPALLARLPDLRGRALACWCAPDACHGDVLKRWAER